MGEIGHKNHPTCQNKCHWSSWEGRLLDEKALWSHLLVPSLLYCMSYNYILLCIVIFPSLTNYYFHTYLPLLFLFVLIILAQPRLRHYVSWYLTTIDLCTHLRDCHPLYNSEVCFLCFCLQRITPILTNPVDILKYRLLSPAPLCVLPLLPHHVHYHPRHL